MPKVIILGSSNAVPTKDHENTHLVIIGEERKILIDNLDTRLDPFDWRASGPVDILDEQQAFVCPLHACDDPDQG